VDHESRGRIVRSNPRWHACPCSSGHDSFFPSDISAYCWFLYFHLQLLPATQDLRGPISDRWGHEEMALKAYIAKIGFTDGQEVTFRPRTMPASTGIQGP